MKKLLVFAFLCVLFISCQKDEIDLSSVSLNKVSFEEALNPSLNNNVTMIFDGASTFTATVSKEADINNLVATFEYDGSSIEINGLPYSDELSSSDFGKEVVVSVFNDTKSASKDYNIRVVYHTGLPILYIDTYGQEITSNETYISAEVNIYGGLDLENLESINVQIRGRGNSSWIADGEVVPKKPYQIKFVERTEVLGMPADRRWVLLAEFWDRTMIRNKISYDMGVMSRFDYSPTGEFIEVVYNGNPLGTYLIAQKVEESTNRVNIGDEGFLLEMDQRGRIDDDDVYFEPPIFREKMQKFWWTDTIFNIKEPKVQWGSQAQRYIENHINMFESVLFGSDFSDPDTGYRAYIDVPSFVDWYLINEIGKSVDAYGYASVFFHYQPGGKIKMGPIWDFDLSYGNADYNQDSFSPQGNWISEHPWFDRMLQDSYFRDKVRNRFSFYFNNKEFFLDKIDGYAQQIDASQKENYALWETLGQEMWNNKNVYDSYEEELNYLKNWLDTRMNWMNGYFN